jgi:hypothetical protein
VGVNSAKASFCPLTMMTPLLEARRCAVMGSTKGSGGGLAGRAARFARFIVG